MALNRIIGPVPVFQMEGAAKACGRVGASIGVEKAGGGHVDGQRLIIQRPCIERGEAIF